MFKKRSRDNNLQTVRTQLFNRLVLIQSNRGQTLEQLGFKIQKMTIFLFPFSVCYKKLKLNIVTNSIRISNNYNSNKDYSSTFYTNILRLQ